MARKPTSRTSAKTASSGPGPEWQDTLEWQDAFDAITDALCLVDLQGTVRRCNRAFAKFVGRTPDDAVGEACCTLIHGGPAHPPQCPLPKMLGTKAHQETEYLLRDRWVWVAADPIFAGPGALVGAVQSLADITERKRAEEALRGSEERHRTILREMIEGYYEVDIKGTMTFCNDTAVAMLGYSRDELIGLNNRAYMDEANAKRVYQTFNRVYRTGESARAFDWELIRKDGTRIAIETSVALMRDAEGRAVGFRGVMHDITERKRAEEALEVSERRFRDFVEHALVGVYRTTGDGRVLMANSAMARLLGFSSREALLQADLEEWSRRHNYPRSNLKEALARDGGLTGRESTFTRDDGTVVHLRESARVVRDETGAMQYFEGIIEDMTEHRRLEEQLRQSQKMEVVGTLAGGVAHDFNNLLQSMLSHAQLLRSHPNDSEKVLAVVRELEQQIQRGASLTRQLLVFSRRGTTKPEPIDLNDAVGDATQILRRLVRANIALSTDLVGGQLPVEADRGQLEQVLMNLALNASDAMPQGGKLQIRTGAIGGGEVWFSVEDTGQGIPETVREHIFEPFFTTKEAGRGTGLGLSVVHGIVTSHAGRIEVESAVGDGSTFRVILPRAASGGGFPEREAVPTLPELELGKGERILVAEDEDGAREGLRDLLTSLGYEVVATESGEAAKQLSVDQPFDVLLTDFMLPGVTGPQLALELQARWPALNVILMSGYAQNEAVRRDVTARKLRFLQKPFDVGTLARELRAALDERADPEGS
jgi:two-component system cell cycle sensor histidine kinase/response regulator CckA